MRNFLNLKYNNYYSYYKKIDYSYIFLLIYLIIFFLKLYLNNELIPLGDELNSILVYSLNIKTLLLKNFPGNTTIFHFFGYLTSFFSYDIFYYKLLSYFFFCLNIIIIYKFCNFFISKLLFLSSLLFSFYIPYYAFIYSGYFFSSFIFILVFFLVEKYIKDQKKLSLIFFLLFLNFYNHLVNLYIIFPFIFLLFFFSKKKNIFFIKLLSYFIAPTLLLYFVSIILTGIAIMKIQYVDSFYVYNFINDNFFDIINIGLNWIFFNEAYNLPLNFKIYDYLNLLNYEDTLYFISIILLLLLSSFFLIAQQKKYYFYIFFIFFHFILILILNKKIYVRSYTGFIFVYYIVLIKYLEYFYLYLYKKKIIKILITFCLMLLIFYKLIFTDYQRNIYSGITSTDFTFEQTKVVKNDLSINDCKLKNNSYLEMEKKSYYYFYLNLCRKKFSLIEFLNFYRG
jgi:hypothetical protein